MRSTIVALVHSFHSAKKTCVGIAIVVTYVFPFELTAHDEIIKQLFVRFRAPNVLLKHRILDT